MVSSLGQDADIPRSPSVPCDERAPLLAERENEIATNSTHDARESIKAGHDGPDQSRLLWTLVSLWLGTLCAGLGAH